jgi:hypothetical protein
MSGRPFYGPKPSYITLLCCTKRKQSLITAILYMHTLVLLSSALQQTAQSVTQPSTAETRERPWPPISGKLRCAGGCGSSWIWMITRVAMLILQCTVCVWLKGGGSIDITVVAHNTTVQLLISVLSEVLDVLNRCGSNTNAGGSAYQCHAISACYLIYWLHNCSIMSLTHACAQADDRFPSFKSPSPAKCRCLLCVNMKLYQLRSTANILTILYCLRMNDSQVNNMLAALNGMGGHFEHIRNVLH